MFSWFCTKNGRLFTNSAVGVITASIFGVQVSLNGPFLDKYQAIVQLYKNNKPQKISPELLNLAQEVVEKSGLEESQKKKISFFVNSGLDVFHAGGYSSPWGAIIGLPLTFDKDANVSTIDLQLVGKHDFDWVLDGQDLLDTVKLSEASQRFAIAREIHSCSIYRVIENAVISAFCFYFPAIMAKHFNKRTNAFVKYKLRQRIPVYGALYGIGYLIYVCMSEPFKHLTDIQADNTAAGISKEYLEGGIEFYLKALERNRQLREIFGSSGKSKITEEGDENYFLLAPKLPLSKRLSLLQELEVKLKK